MRKSIFPTQRHSKLLPRGDGPFRVPKRINDSACELDSPGEYNVSATFNITDWSPFDVGDDSRTNTFQEEGNDEGTTNPNPIQVPNGPVTRARAKRFKKTLNGRIQNIWTEVNSCSPKEDAPRAPTRMVFHDSSRGIIRQYSSSRRTTQDCVH